MRFNKVFSIKAAYQVSLFALFVICVCTSWAKATALAPFIDLQEQGLTVVSSGVGLQGFSGTTRQISVNVGGTVRFALLYWNGRDIPCPFNGTNCTLTQPYKDQVMVFNGNTITGTLIGSETSAGPTNNIGYYADVTSIVAAAGTGAKTFNIQDGDTSSNLAVLDGMSLVVGYTNAANPNTYRVQIYDDLDFAYANDSTTAGQQTAAVTFNHGSITGNRTAQLTIIAGNGTSAGTDSILISNNTTISNALDASSGSNWDNDTFNINIPSGVSTTSVQVASSGASPDSLLWQAAILRTSVTAAPTVTVTTNNGPPFQASFRVQDTGSGLQSIVVTQSNNADTPVPPFTVGTTDPVTVTSTKIDQTKPLLVSLQVTDQAGNVTNFTYTDAPTAATVAISGRVTTADGRGIKNIRLSLTDSSGQIRTATTTSFGYYRFDDVEVGQTYILAASGKHYTFSQSVQVLNVNEETTHIDFVANSEKRERFF